MARIVCPGFPVVTVLTSQPVQKFWPVPKSWPWYNGPLFSMSFDCSLPVFRVTCQLSRLVPKIWLVRLSMETLSLSQDVWSRPLWLCGRVHTTYLGIYFRPTFKVWLLPWNLTTQLKNLPGPVRDPRGREGHPAQPDRRHRHRVQREDDRRRGLQERQLPLRGVLQGGPTE